MQAPRARKEPRRLWLHGQQRSDDYAWLHEKDSPRVLEYLRAENAYTDAQLARLEPLRRTLYGEIVSRIQEADLSVPYPLRGHWYYQRTEAGLQHPILCRKRGSLEAPEQITLDLNALRAQHSYLGLGAYEVSDDGERLAYSLDTSGFRLYALRVVDLAQPARPALELAQRVTSFAFAADGETLFYATENRAKRPYQLWRQRIGAGPQHAVLVYEEADERFRLSVRRTRSGSFLLLELRSLTTSEVHWLPAGDPEGRWRVIAPRQPEHRYEVDHRGAEFYIRSNDRGSHFRLVAAPVEDPCRERWAELLPHRPEVMLARVDCFRDHYVALTRRDALPRLEVRDYTEHDPHEVEFGEPAYDLASQPNPEFTTSAFRFGFTSLVTPLGVYEVELSTRAVRLLKQQPVLGGYDPSQYRSERIWAHAADGTRIPISLVSRADAPRDGSAPLLLQGYGAYGFSSPAAFDPARISLLERGVSFAIAHVRGGGELGKQWHDRGRMLHKRNTFTDFIACAEQLIERGYTAPERLAISGGSAGGLLVGTVLNMRPQLFRAALARVPFVDVINTMLDESLPLTVIEFEEWGNPRELEQYEYLVSYSPCDNVTAQDYPALLVVAAYNDSQVMYWEPAKWVALLRDRKTDANPLLLRTDLEPSGHGGRSGRYEQLQERAFELAFLLDQLGVHE